MRRLLLLGGCLLLWGCTNAPGALQMRMSPEELQIAPNQPASVRATLIAAGGDVVLARRYGFAVEVRAADGHVYTVDPAELPPTREGAHGFLVNGPVAVVDTAITLHALGDLADLSDRYRVLHRNETAQHQLDVVLLSPRGKTPAVQFGEAGQAGADVVRQLPAGWAPGEYWIVVRLVNQDVRDHFPAPLFWTPYDQVVEGRMRLIVTGPAGAALPPPLEIPPAAK